MKTNPPTEHRRESASRLQSGGEPASSRRMESQPTSVILRSAKDTRRQHGAIRKLMEMCLASPVVKQASRGITAEVRKDRDRDHD